MVARPLVLILRFSETESEVQSLSLESLDISRARVRTHGVVVGKTRASAYYNMLLCYAASSLDFLFIVHEMHTGIHARQRQSLKSLTRGCALTKLDSLSLFLLLCL